MKIENFTISAEVSNEDYSVDVALTEEQNEYFVSLGLKNYCANDDVTTLNAHNNSVLDNLSAQQYKEFSTKCVELISTAFSQEKLSEVCFQTHCATDTHYLK